MLDKDILKRYIEVYNNEGEEVCIGAYLIDRRKLPITKKEIYVGWDFALEDVLNKPEVTKLFDSADIMKIKDVYEKCGATGIIYFPQTKNYGFLEKGDVVLPWTGKKEIQQKLDEYIYENYKVKNFDKYFENLQALDNKINNLDPEDPFVEFYDDYYKYSLKREASSR